MGRNREGADGKESKTLRPRASRQSAAINCMEIRAEAEAQSSGAHTIAVGHMPKQQVLGGPEGREE